MIGESAARFATPDQPRAGIVRGLPNTYEVDAFGGTVSTIPAAQYHKGAIMRMYQPELRMPPPTPMYDPTDTASRLAQGWAG